MSVLSRRALPGLLLVLVAAPAARAAEPETGGSSVSAVCDSISNLSDLASASSNVTELITEEIGSPSLR